MWWYRHIGLMRTVKYLNHGYEYERLSAFWSEDWQQQKQQYRGVEADGGGVVGGGGVWALVRMMLVDYTQPQMMCCPAHITMNASLSHYLYIMATTPRRGQASSRLINPLTARPKEKWGARQRCSPLIHRLYLTPQPLDRLQSSLYGLSYLFRHVISLYT